MKRSRLISFQMGRCRCGLPGGNKISKDVRMKCKHFLPVFLGAFLLLSISVSYAQQTRTISGVVSSSQQNVPLAGVSIMAKGTNTGTFTTMSGSYRITIPATVRALVFSYVGYRTQEVPITGNDLNVTLYPDSANTLGDVVVIGYGAVRKGDATGSISTISSKDFQTGAITSPAQLIAGKAAGVSIISNGGAPGGGNTIRIRGMASLNGSNDPLIVIDGLPFAAQTISGISDPLSLINPDDIASFTILKDASATAIYGSRASNGVILITTKKGTIGKPKFNFNTTFSLSTPEKYLPVLSAAQFRDYVNTYGDSAEQSLMGNASTNWQKVIYQTAITTNNDLSVSGSFGKYLPYRVSVNYLNQQGILKTDNLQRGTGSISLTPSLFTNHLKIELNLSGSLSKSRFADQGAIGAAAIFDPTQPVYDKSNALFGGYYQWMNANGTPNSLATHNPLATLEQRHNVGQAQRSFGNLKLDYSLHFLPELHLIANWGYDVSQGYGNDEYDSTNRNVYTGVYAGKITHYHQNTTNVAAEYTLNYIKDFPSIKSNINAMATYGYYNNKQTSGNFASYDLRDTLLPGTTPVFPNDVEENTLISYVGRLIYTFDEKYTLTASLRRDETSKLAPGYRAGTLPGIALGWNIKKEDFLKDAKTISDLKLRLSYGKTGNVDGLSNYGYIPVYNLSSASALYQFGNNFYPLFAPAPYVADLRWEQTASTDIGIDYGFLNDRISGSIDYYSKHTNGLIATVPIAAGTNFTNAVTKNIGSMNSHGLEFNINASPIRSKDIDWNLNFNLTTFSIKVLKIGNNDSTAAYTGGISGGTGNTVQISEKGITPFSYYVYHQVYNENRQPIEGVYEDVNRDGVINQEDEYPYHSSFPTLEMGFSTSFRYKKWTIATVLRSNIGAYNYNNVESNLGNNATMLNPSAGYLANSVTDILKTNFQNPQYFSDYYVQNASFLRMDNLSLTYQVGAIFDNKANLSISANCQNVFVITKYPGLDPEISSGLDNNFYPRPRTYSLGLNIGF